MSRLLNLCGVNQVVAWDSNYTSLSSDTAATDRTDDNDAKNNGCLRGGGFFTRKLNEKFDVGVQRAEGLGRVPSDISGQNDNVVQEPIRDHALLDYSGICDGGSEGSATGDMVASEFNMSQEAVQDNYNVYANYRLEKIPQPHRWKDYYEHNKIFHRNCIPRKNCFNNYEKLKDEIDDKQCDKENNKQEYSAKSNTESCNKALENISHENLKNFIIPNSDVTDTSAYHNNTTMSKQSLYQTYHDNGEITCIDVLSGGSINNGSSVTRLVDMYGECAVEKMQAVPTRAESVHSVPVVRPVARKANCDFIRNRNRVDKEIITNQPRGLQRLRSDQDILCQHEYSSDSDYAVPYRSDENVGVYQKYAEDNGNMRLVSYSKATGGTEPEAKHITGDNLNRSRKILVPRRADSTIDIKNYNQMPSRHILYDAQNYLVRHSLQDSSPKSNWAISTTEHLYENSPVRLREHNPGSILRKNGCVRPVSAYFSSDFRNIDEDILNERIQTTYQRKEELRICARKQSPSMISLNSTTKDKPNSFSPRHLIDRKTRYNRSKSCILPSDNAVSTDNLCSQIYTNIDKRLIENYSVDSKQKDGRFSEIPNRVGSCIFSETLEEDFTPYMPTEYVPSPTRYPHPYL